MSSLSPEQSAALSNARVGDIIFVERNGRLRKILRVDSFRMEMPIRIQILVTTVYSREFGSQRTYCQRGAATTKVPIEQLIQPTDDLLLNSNYIGPQRNSGPALSKHSFEWCNQARERVLNDMCGFCLDNFDVGQEIVDLECVHFFHEKCIRLALKFKRECPLCLQPVGYQRASDDTMRGLGSSSSVALRGGDFEHF